MSQGAVYETYMFEFTLSEKWSEQSEIKLLWKFQVSSKTGWKRTLHNSQQLKHFFFFCFRTFLSERWGFLPPSQLQRICQCLHQTCLGICATFLILFYLFFLRWHKTQIFKQGSKQRDKEPPQSGKEERNGEWEEEPTPAAGALFEVRLAAQTTNDKHRAEHCEADKAPARVSAPSAGENVQKRERKKSPKLATTNVRKKNVSEQTLI